MTPTSSKSKLSVSYIFPCWTIYYPLSGESYA